MKRVLLVLLTMSLLFNLPGCQKKSKVTPPGFEHQYHKDGQIYVDNESEQIMGYGDYSYVYDQQRRDVACGWTWLDDGQLGWFGSFKGGTEIWLPYRTYFAGWNNTAHFVVDGNANVVINRGGSYGIVGRQ
jgi:hypothetical protein